MHREIINAMNEELSTSAQNGEAAYSIMVSLTNYVEELKQKIPHWIPVTERLPNEYGEYLVLWKPRKEGILPRNKLFYEIVEYEMDYNGIDGEWIGEIPQSAPMGGYEVCYWMDLPPEPRKEKT